MLIESKLTPPNGSCAQDAVGTGVADQYRHLLVCFAESQKHFTFTMGLEGWVSSLGVKGRNYGAVVKFKSGISDLFPKYLGALFCSL